MNESAVGNVLADGAELNENAPHDDVTAIESDIDIEVKQDVDAEDFEKAGDTKEKMGEGCC